MRHPIAAAKNAVGRSMPASFLISQANPNPRPIAQATPARIQPPLR